MTGWIDGSWHKLRDWASREASALRAEARLILARADCLQLAIERSEGIAAGQIVRDFHELDLREVIDDILAVLRQCLVVMITTTGGGALIGGIAGGIGGAGVGAIPGAAIGATAGAQVGEWILIVMGLKALTEYIVHDMPQIARNYRDGLRQAWLAASPPPLPQQQVQVDAFALQNAAATLARGHVQMFVLLLVGIVAYLAKGRGTIGELADNVRSSKLGTRFADWMRRNEGKLKAEPRLQPLEEARSSNRVTSKSNGPDDRPPPGKQSAPAPKRSTNPAQKPKNDQPPPKPVAPLEDVEVSGLKAERILPGSNGKVAVIGRTMGNDTRVGVRDYGNGLSDLGYKTELFDGTNISKSALDEFQQVASQAKQDFAAGLRDSEYLTSDEIKQTMLYQENISWATKLKAQSYTVVDLGNPYNLDNSAFYDVETQILFPQGPK
ncbi:MAG TPA: hypothetical protein VN043_04515 [Rhodanobacter sp.]|nr:hypothetical protein [Rhodanobacter sp.]